MDASPPLDQAGEAGTRIARIPSPPQCLLSDLDIRVLWGPTFAHRHNVKTCETHKHNSLHLLVSNVQEDRSYMRQLDYIDFCWAFSLDICYLSLTLDNWNDKLKTRIVAEPWKRPQSSWVIDNWSSLQEANQIIGISGIVTCNLSLSTSSVTWR